MSEFKHQAVALLRKSEDDLNAALCLAKDATVSHRSVGFHAQQTVEKALKAVLMYREMQYPFTHDIRALMKLAEKVEVSLPSNADELPSLTPFATILRYEDDEWDLG
jgi:HEPN domain-containing protein